MKAFALCAATGLILIMATTEAQAQNPMIEVTPRCTFENDSVMTFSFTMPNPTGIIQTYVYGINTVALWSVTVWPGGTSTSNRQVTTGVATHRLRPYAWCMRFTTAGAASTYLQNRQNDIIDPIQIHLTGHGMLRSQIESSLSSLVVAIDSNSGDVQDLRDQIEQLELDDELSRLEQIDTITNTVQNFLIPGADGTHNDGAIVKLDLDVFQLKHSSAGAAIVDEANEEVAGAYCWRNDDNDNGNPMSDLDTNPISNENDLIPVWWFFAKPTREIMNSPGWSLRISGSEGSSERIRPWTSSIKESNESLPRTIDGTVSYDSFYGEGRTASPSDGAELFTAAFATTIEDRVRVTVVDIHEVTFDPDSNLEEAGGYSFGLFNTTTMENVQKISGGEFRLFPCKNSPSDSPHTTIGVTVRIKPVKQNVRIWTKACDVDDPTYVYSPVDDETLSQDNRLSPGGSRKDGLLKWPGGGVVADSQGRLDRLTTASGEANVDFDVSGCMQPGNNFRILASFTRDRVTAHTVPQSDIQAKVNYNGTPPRRIQDGSGPDSQFKQSPLLTIWRRLHIEVDQMSQAAYSTWNWATGDTLDAMGANYTGLGIEWPIWNGTVQAQWGFLDAGFPNSAGRFENGHIDANGLSRNVLSNNQNGIVVDVDARNLEYSSFELYDDDTVLGQPNVPIQYLAANSINPQSNTLALACIEPVYDGGGSQGFNSDALTFYMNLDDQDGCASVHDNKGCWANNSNSFWVAYLQVAFQGWNQKVEWNPITDEDEDCGDNDPDSELTHTTGVTYPQWGGSLIFMEVIEDHMRENNWSGTTVANNTTVHELCHQLSAGHNGAEDDPDIMGDLRLTNERLWFNAISLDSIRGLAKPIQQNRN